jgi:hypothetical protein
MVVQEYGPGGQPMGGAGCPLHPVRVDQDKAALRLRDQVERKGLKLGRWRGAVGLRHEDRVIRLA